MSQFADLRAPWVPARPPLVRAQPKVLAGVCRGLANHLGTPVWPCRTLMLAATPLFLIGPIIYVVLALSIGTETGQADPFQRLAPSLSEDAAGGPGVGGPETGGPDDGGLDTSGRASTGSTRREGATLQAWLFLLVIVALVFTMATGSRAGVGAVGLLIVIAGAGLSWSAASAARPGLRTIAGCTIAALGALAVVLVVNPADGFPFALTSGAAVLFAVGLCVYPANVRARTLVRDSELARAREEERADIAAHLHDSVLQTLALIYARSEDPQAVRTLTRQQEKELRDFLYRRRAAAGESIAQELEARARELELAYDAEIDVVTSGDAPVTTTAKAVLDAAREAMTNACKYGGGRVSVYAEVGQGMQLWVKDRGPGFDVQAASAGRAGIRESIVGRMERAGGTATIRSPLESGGTEVYLQVSDLGQE